MRRVEVDTRGAPPFRVLGEGGQIYVVPSAPPSLAPEPYKVTTSSTSSNRARRRSSFVIIAEARPATPTSRSPSPGLATGRASPFRGRGFKGPPPRAQSRPQTPELKDARRPSRVTRRMSTSQQNSPKRSLIPQPARRRSVSLTKTETNGRSSPKYGRRATSKNYLEVNQQIAPSRRGSLKVPGLSPIQGTPTKPLEKKKSTAGLRNEAAEKKSSPIKSRRSSTLPPIPKTVGGLRGSISGKTTKPLIKTGKVATNNEPPMSPSKIPVKKGAVPEPKVIMKGNPRRGSLAKLAVPKPGDKNGQKKEKVEVKNESKPVPGTATESSQLQKSAKKTENKTEALQDVKKTSKETENSTKETSLDVKDIATPKSKVVDEISLMELLKQSSGASGTSSVVNTTTVTAAQPLKIDAVGTIIAEEDIKAKDKEPEVKRRNPDSGKRSAVARPTAMNIPSSSTASPALSVSGKLSQPSAQDGGPNNPQEGAVKNEEVTNHANGNKNQHNKSGSGQILTGSSGKIVTGEGFRDRNSVQSKDTNGVIAKETKTSLSGGSGSLKSEDRGIQTPVTTIGSEGGSQASSAVVMMGGVRNSEDQNHRISGSAMSMKSTAGLSTGSTDTGVSVNTVRGGVSSAREKRGMHLVKGHSQGIETLSGNVMHLERNGEPMLPGGVLHDLERVTRPAGEGLPNPRVPGEQESSSKWKRFFGRCCGPCSKCKLNCCKGFERNMRCLACRRGFKSQTNNPPILQDANNEVNKGCLSKLKDRTKCCRFPESWKGCSRGSRVAPAEESSCCPPERRCGNIFRRLCSRCSCCKRQDASQQIRNVQAKQSLTSVAAPVLSEEPKSKIPEVLVEHNAPMRGSIPCLPIPLAWFCLVWNVLIPGTGTFWSGLFNLCVGQPRFSAVATPRARVGAFLINTIVGVGQLFTVLFCLVGWGWSIWWGVMMVRLARKYKRFRDSEAANNDVEARGAAAEATTGPPGVPSQPSRGFERAR